MKTSLENKIIHAVLATKTINDAVIFFLNNNLSLIGGVENESRRDFLIKSITEILKNYIIIIARISFATCDKKSAWYLLLLRKDARWYTNLSDELLSVLYPRGLFEATKKYAVELLHMAHVHDIAHSKDEFDIQRSLTIIASTVGKVTWLMCRGIHPQTLFMEKEEWHDVIGGLAPPAVIHKIRFYGNTAGVLYPDHLSQQCH